MFRKDRSDEPIFWGLFGAGGMAIAIILPIIVFAALICRFCDTTAFNFMLLAGLPIGVGSVIGKTVCLALGLGFVSVMILTVWHALHRVFHGLHDLGIHTNAFIHVAIYGLATVISIMFVVFYLIAFCRLV